jgi:hypothetical protein
MDRRVHIAFRLLLLGPGLIAGDGAEGEAVGAGGGDIEEEARTG